MQKSKIEVFDDVKSYIVAFLMVSAYFLFQIVSFRYAVIFCSVGAVICFYHYRFSLRGFIEEFYPVRFLILSYIGVIIMALISIHFAFDGKATFKAIGIFLVGPFFLALMFYFVIKNLPQKALAFFFFCLGIIIFLQPLVTIYHYFNASSFPPIMGRFVGFGDFSVIPYGLFLILAFSLSFSMAVYLKGKFRILACLLFCMSLFAMYANGTRALILAIVAMLLLSLVLFRKKIGKKITLLISAVIFFVLLGGYCLSSHFSERFDFRKMLENIGTVWNYAPAEMGRFDVFCFNNLKSYKCSKFSGSKLDDHLHFEVNALDRLSLLKATPIYISKNPFRPNGFGAQFFYKNFSQNVSIDSKEHMYHISSVDNPDSVPHTHMHNMIISFIFELGVIGFGLIVIGIFVLVRICFVATKAASSTYLDIPIFGFLIFLTGLIVFMFFDVVLAYSKVDYSFFILCAIALGLACRKSNKENDLSSVDYQGFKQ